jgi:DUF4097 and DUF4098 domain-containing protein YvlB
MSTHHFLGNAFHGRASRGFLGKAGLLVPGLLLAGVAPALADHFEKHFKVDARPVITIHNPTGLVTVKAWTKSEVEVMADHASANIEVDADQTGNRIDVITRLRTDSASPDEWRADYEIRVPEDAELQIHDDSGGVNVNNVLGDMNVETVAADVDLEDAAGYLTVKTVCGSFQCERCAGRIEASSISGTFKLIDLHSLYVRARTSNGNILFDGEFLPNGMYSLNNYSGVIEVRFSPGDSFDLSAASLKGKVNNEAYLTPHANDHHFSPKFGDALFGTFNTGHARVDLTSFDGTINILKRD